jgi:hypothetical protein
MEAGRGSPPSRCPLSVQRRAHACPAAVAPPAAAGLVALLPLPPPQPGWRQPADRPGHRRDDEGALALEKHRHRQRPDRRVLVGILLVEQVAT